jgi:PAS domain S-box-containing protein
VSPGQPADWLSTTAAAVRELIVERLKAGSLDAGDRRAMEMALEELDIIWEQLKGQTALLALEKERYAEFFEHAPEAYLITDIGGGIREANRAALELLKAVREDVVGRQLSDYVAGDERMSFLTRTAGLAGAKPVSWQARLQPRQGLALGCELSVRAIALQRSGVGGLCWRLRP